MPQVFLEYLLTDCQLLKNNNNFLGLHSLQIGPDYWQQLNGLIRHISNIHGPENDPWSK